MKQSKLFLALTIASAVASLAAPMATQASESSLSPNVTSSAQAVGNDGAADSVSVYTGAALENVSHRTYLEALAYKAMSAEACLVARSKRLMSNDVLRAGKDERLLLHFSLDKLNAYREFAKGSIYRINSLEVLTCDTAHLAIGRTKFD